MGSYGMVYKGMWKGIEVAVKKFIQQKLDEWCMLEFRAGNLIGRVIGQILAGLVDNVIKLCKKDEMYKEAFVEKVTAKKIKFVVSSEGPVYYPGKTSFPEGVLVVTIHKEKPWVNVSQTGNEIESQL
jgi:hypothetical protein